MVGLQLKNSGDRVDAKLVDLDPDQQMVSMIFGLQVRIADPVSGAVLMTGADFLLGHDALRFVLAVEPELLLPHISFARGDVMLALCAARVAPAFTRFLDDRDATRLGEWIARITLSYLFSPSESFDIGDAAQVRALVDDFVLPGFVKSEGVFR